MRAADTRPADVRPPDMRPADMRRVHPTAAACPNTYSAPPNPPPCPPPCPPPPRPPPPPRASASSVRRGTTRSSVAAMQAQIVNIGLTALRDWARRAPVV